MAAQDLTTTARVKTHLGIKDTDTGADTLLGWLVTACSSWLIRQLGNRPIKSATFIEQFSGTGERGLTLAHGPVTAVNFVKVDGDPIPVRPSVVDDGYVIDNGRIVLTAGYVFTPGVLNVEVSYIAGWSAVPEDIEQSVVLWVCELFRARDRVGLASRTVPSGETVSFKPDTIPVYVEMTLDSYRRVLGVPQ